MLRSRRLEPDQTTEDEQEFDRYSPTYLMAAGVLLIVLAIAPFLIGLGAPYLIVGLARIRHITAVGAIVSFVLYFPDRTGHLSMVTAGLVLATLVGGCLCPPLEPSGERDVGFLIDLAKGSVLCIVAGLFFTALGIQSASS